jgi:alkylation response protein AidB-like acyl-CoA dehydrogenase
MDFTFTEDQTAIRDLAAQIFTDKVTDEYLLEYYKQDKVYDAELWSLLAEQGLLGVAIPESAGGTGLGFTELCLVLQEQARRLAPIPLLSNLVMGALPLAEFGTEEQQQKWLTPLVSGEHQLSAALAELGMIDAVAGQVHATKEGNGWVLNGVLQAVPYATEAACILVPAVDCDGNKTMFLVETIDVGVSLEAQHVGLGKLQATLSLTNAHVGPEDILGKIGQADEIATWIEQRANTALAGMQVGTCEEALRRTAEFTGERKQFGAPIGSFQAVAMRAADAFIDIEAIRSTFWQAMWRLSEGLDAEPEVRAAKYFACIGGHRVVYSTQHLHGGLGVHVEYPIHRYFLFAKHTEFMLGGRTTQLAKMGAYLAANDDSGPRWMAE